MRQLYVWNSGSVRDGRKFFPCQNPAGFTLSLVIIILCVLRISCFEVFCFCYYLVTVFHPSKPDPRFQIEFIFMILFCFYFRGFSVLAFVFLYR